LSLLRKLASDSAIDVFVMFHGGRYLALHITPFLDKFSEAGDIMEL